MSEATLAQIKDHHFGLWERNLDRIFLLTFFNGRLANPTGFKLFRYFQKSLQIPKIGSGLSGFQQSNQIFSPGYPLHISHLSDPDAAGGFPGELKGRALRVLYIPERVPELLRENFAGLVAELTGTKPEYRAVDLTEIGAVTKKGDFDFYMGSFGVADPNYEGALSFFYELTPPPFASLSSPFDFAAQSAALRAESNPEKRLLASRKLVADTVTAGSVVPLFHFSTTVIARPELDLSQVPTTDETVNFARVRFKDGA